ncbi:5-hydroxytryptamine receptor 3C-like [Entelurus aequoreus]|uniref:5-hydroxytryptamine receptor 3C-like n=1 Tax=Entelurus aequoreus TaxID=161455 RepID=UPI002B1CEF80|nr:5-hydroxytryptamine receptor 3C-like [Entelurus aequoreus]
MNEDKAPFVPYVNLHSDGSMEDAKPARVVSSCRLDIYTFPFDVQECTLTFSAFITVGTELKVFPSSTDEEITKVSKDVMTTLGEWELLDITSEKISHQHESEGHLIDELAFHIRVRRRSTLYVVNLLIPSCFLITVDLFSFLLPPQSVDRSSFKMTLILGYTVFLLIMNDLLPITGNTIPLINVFFCLCLALMVASLLETVLITNLLLGSKNLRPVPRWVRALVLRTLGGLVGLPWRDNKEADTRASPVSEQRRADGAPEEEKGPVVEDNALQELRSLGADLKVIRLQVEQQLGVSQSSEEWIQCCPQKIKSSVVLFIFISLFMHGSCNSIMPNCSRPDSLALLEALRPVFNLSSIRPVVNISTPTHVSIDFILVNILGVDEKAQILTTYIFQYLMWRNEFVSWNPTECGTKWLTVPRKLLWIPDVVINEFMERNLAQKPAYTYLSHNGTVFDAQPVRVVSSCRLDTYAFPFDIQNCTLTFNSYLHHTSAMQLGQIFTTEKILEFSRGMIKTKGEWELLGIAASINRLPSSASVGEHYDELRFFISLRRRSTLYVVNLLIPSCFLITVDLFSFLLPPQSVDRSSFKMTLILGYTVFLLIMNDLLPITGNTIPLINVFLSVCLALMVASLLETVLITNLLQGSSRQSQLPGWLRLIVINMLGRLVLLPPKSTQAVVQNPFTLEDMEAVSGRAGVGGALRKEGVVQQELRRLGEDLRVIRLRLEQEVAGGQSSEEWVQVGFIVDRLLFAIYIIFISASFLTISLIWVNS